MEDLLSAFGSPEPHQSASFDQLSEPGSLGRVVLRRRQAQPPRKLVLQHRRGRVPPTPTLIGAEPSGSAQSAFRHLLIALRAHGLSFVAVDVRDGGGGFCRCDTKPVAHVAPYPSGLAAASLVERRGLAAVASAAQRSEVVVATPVRRVDAV
jgi:hypothetical protein